MQLCAFQGPHADLSLRVAAGRVMASGSCASSAVMSSQHGQPNGGAVRKDDADACRHGRKRLHGHGGPGVRRSGLG